MGRGDDAGRFFLWALAWVLLVSLAIQLWVVLPVAILTRLLFR